MGGRGDASLIPSAVHFRAAIDTCSDTSYYLALHAYDGEMGGVGEQRGFWEPLQRHLQSVDSSLCIALWEKNGAKHSKAAYS